MQSVWVVHFRRSEVFAQGFCRRRRGGAAFRRVRIFVSFELFQWKETRHGSCRRGCIARRYERADDALRTEVGWLESPPVGGISHITWCEDDGLHGVDVWESEDAFHAFGQERLAPGLAKVGIASQPEATFRPAHEVYVPQAVTLTR